MDQGKRSGASVVTLLGVVLATVLAAAGPVQADAPWPDDVAPPASSEASASSEAPAQSGPAPAAGPVLSVPTSRVGGSSRYATAALIARRAFPSRAATVYLARSDDHADAIAAGALTDGPVLLVPRCGAVPKVVLDEIRRLDPVEVVAIGGTGSVCDATLATAAEGRTSGRLPGVDRYDTAALIAARAFPEGSATVYLAESAESIDAVAGGVLADGPILLVGRGSATVPDRTAEAVESLNPASVVALGGTAVVTGSALDRAAAGRSTDRVAGPDRYATSAAIARRAFPSGSPRAYLANGATVVDAVVGGTLTDGPILLVARSCGVLPEPVWRRLSAAPPGGVTALGGTDAVCSRQLSTAGRLSVFSAMEKGDTARLYDVLTKKRTVDPLRYTPGDLQRWRSTAHRLRPEAITMLEELFDAADAAGRGGLRVTSAFRSYDEQASLYAYWVRTVGQQRADQISARPGHSEHQLGLTVDIAGPTACSGYACFGSTPEGRWVAANAYRYGWIIRYPKGGVAVTGYDYEPWHLRYVGPRAAWMMHVRGEVYWDTYQPTAVRDAR